MKIKIITGVFLVALISCSSATFNAADWKNGDKSVRGKMSSDIIEKRVLENKSKHEVLELLGNPDVVNNGCFSYNLDLGGYNSLLNWSYYLVVGFDENSGITNYVQISD